MRVAWVTPYAPDRDGGGGQIRQAHLLLALAAEADVVLVSAQPVEDRAVRDAAEVIEAKVDPVGPAGIWSRRADDARGAMSRTTSREVRALAGVRAALGRALRSVRADVVMVEFAGLAPLVDEPGLRAAVGAQRWVLTLHNLPSRMAAHQAAVMPRRRQRWLFGRDEVAAGGVERRAVDTYDLVVTVSAEDAARLGGGPGVVVVPNGVDIRRFLPSAVPRAPGLLFAGALYTAPNTDAAVWLCREVLPLVRRAVPAATVDVVGAAPPAAVAALRSLPGVSVHADVPSVGPHLAAARVAVVPIRIGSGTRLKALEAWAAGRPVVGTTIGLEGVGAIHGRNALVADTAPSFADEVVSLLGDDRLAERLAAAGRRSAEQEHDWTRIGRDLADLVVEGVRPAGAG